jgi:hypothetical protein
MSGGGIFSPGELSTASRRNVALGGIASHADLAGILKRMEGGAFPHERFGFSLAAHRTTAGGQPFTCASCHGAASFRFEPAPMTARIGSSRESSITAGSPSRSAVRTRAWNA